MNQPQKDDLLVIDHSTSEEYKVRKHDILINGSTTTITFTHGEPTILPFAQAAKFRNLEGFTVKKADGSDLPETAVASDSVSSMIGPDECVAKFSELTFEALKLRAAKEKDGEVFLDVKESEDARLDIITFLSPESPATAPSEDGTIDGEDDLIDDSDDEDDTDLQSDDLETIAVENGVILDDVEGTGENGEVTRADLDKYIEDHKPVDPAETEEGSQGLGISAQD